MKKVLSLLLALVTVLALTACRKDDGKVENKKSELEGRWSWSVTMDSALMGIDNIDTTFTVTVNFEFSNGNFLMAMDQQAMEKSSQIFVDDLVDKMLESGMPHEVATDTALKINPVTIFTQAIKDMPTVATYTTEGDQLTLTDADNEKLIYTYRLDSDKLTLIPESDESHRMLDALNLDTMELTRVN